MISLTIETSVASFYFSSQQEAANKFPLILEQDYKSNERRQECKI